MFDALQCPAAPWLLATGPAAVKRMARLAISLSEIRCLVHAHTVLTVLALSQLCVWQGWVNVGIATPAVATSAHFSAVWFVLNLCGGYACCSASALMPVSASASGADTSNLWLLTLLGPASMPHVTAEAMAPLSSISAMTCPSLKVGPLLLPFQGPPPV
jgi:hypothetical protein